MPATLATLRTITADSQGQSRDEVTNRLDSCREENAGQTPRVFGAQDSAQLHALGGGTRLFDNLLKGFTGIETKKMRG